MSCVTNVIGTSGRVITTQSTRITQQESTVSYLGSVSSVIYTTCVPVAVRNESTCEPSTGTSITTVPGKIEQTQVQVTLTVDEYITEYNTLYSTSCISSSQANSDMTTTTTTPPITTSTSTTTPPITTTTATSTTPPTTTTSEPIFTTTTTPPPPSTTTTTPLITTTSSEPISTTTSTTPPPPSATTTPPITTTSSEPIFTTTTTPPPSTTTMATTITPPMTTTSSESLVTTTTTTTPPPSTTTMTTTTTPPVTTTSPEPITTTPPSAALSPTFSLPNMSTVTTTNISVSTVPTSSILTPGTRYPVGPNILNTVDHSTPLGPVVGGVLGGLAGVALLGIVVYYIVFSKSARGKNFPYQSGIPGGDEEVLQNNGQLYNQTFSQMEDWSADHLYSSLDNSQGQLAQMQNFSQTSDQHGQLQSSQGVQTQVQCVHYPQADTGQHALQGGESHQMQRQGVQSPQPDPGQHALHGGESQGLTSNVQGTHYNGQVQITPGISEMAQERLSAAAAISTGAFLGASLGAYTASTAATGKHTFVASTSSGSFSVKGSDTYPRLHGESQTSDPSTITPFILSTLRPDVLSSSPSQLSSPSSTSITPFILSPLRHEELPPRYTSASHAEPLKSSAAQRSNKTDSSL